MKKHPEFINHTHEPVNAEAPLHHLRQNFITPLDLFYIRNHGDVPQIDLDSFQLQVNGLVQEELQFTLGSLKDIFSETTVVAALQCAGNRREQLIDVAPVPGEVPWKNGAIGNAEWTGVKLKDVLLKAGINEGAHHVAFMGAEAVYRNGKNVGFGSSIPIAKAMSDEVLLAYAMNGKPLLPEHGFPLRLIAPGYIAARSVKWLTQITLQQEPSLNYFQDHAYRLFPPNANPETVEWNSGLQLGELAVNCVITSPADESTLTAQQVEVSGFAISGGGRKIARVDVSADGGTSWTNAEITHGQNPWSWTFWEAKVSLSQGRHEIIARAVDSASNSQPSDPRHVWNFKGYMNNAWHRVQVEVR